MFPSIKSSFPNKFTIALGELIKKARLSANLSQKELADRAYFTQAAVSQIETGKRAVSAEEIVYLSNALNKPIVYFFSMEFINPVNNNDLSVLEQELLKVSRNLDQKDLIKIIAQMKAIVEL